MVRTLRLAAVLALLACPALTAQLEPLGAPRGTLRFDVGGLFQSADQAYESGHLRDYLGNFGGNPFGATQLGFMAPADTLLGQILGQPGYHLSLGRQRARGQLTVGSGIIGGALGVTSRLTLFARVPIVTSRVQANLRLDSTSADGGLNPAHPDLGNTLDQGRAATFLTTFDAALADLSARIANGSYAGNPGLDSLARAVAASSQVLRDRMAAVTTDPNTAAYFLPATDSPTGLALAARLRALSDTLTATLGVGTALVDPVLANNRLTDQEFGAFLTQSLGPVFALPVFESKFQRAGDTDVGAIYTLIDRFDRPGRPGGFRLAVTGLLRLPTGQRDNPDNLIDVGTGNGRYEAGVSGTADLGSTRWGARLTGGYLVRFTSLRVRRVALPTQPYASYTNLANISLNAGDVASLGVRPFYRLADNFALSGSLDWWHAGPDQASYWRAKDVIPGVSASDLAAGTGGSALALGAGVSYVGRAAHECEPHRRCGWPIDATWSYSTVIRGSGGRVEKFRSTRFEVRWYQRLWR